MAIKIPDIERYIRAFYFDVNVRNHERNEIGRNTSWDDCFTSFHSLRDSVKRNPRAGESIVENAALRLGFYLASWGMFRTSGNLYRYSHRIHIPALGILLDARYKILWNADPVSLLSNSAEGEYCECLRSLRHELSTAYEKASLGKDKEKKVNLTPTLYSKILLGTMAAVPAYDRLFVQGLDKVELRQDRFSRAFSERSWRQLLTFYCEHKSEFEDAREGLVGKGQTYPPMKLVDMYFWKLGATP